LTVIVSLILTLLYSADKNTTTPHTTTESTITITGNAKIIVVYKENSNYNSYGPKAGKIITKDNGKFEFIKAQESTSVLSKAADSFKTTVMGSELTAETLLALPTEFTIEKAYLFKIII